MTDLPPRPAASRSTGGRRRHPAAGSRIAVAGLGATTMFGIVAALGLSETAATADVTAGDVPPPPSSQLVPPLPVAAPIAPPVPATVAATVAPAAPDVRVVAPPSPPVAPPPTAPVTVPVATTSGSS